MPRFNFGPVQAFLEATEFTIIFTNKKYFQVQSKAKCSEKCVFNYSSCTLKLYTVILISLRRKYQLPFCRDPYPGTLYHERSDKAQLSLPPKYGIAHIKVEPLLFTSASLAIV